jgi:hypothetical protein
MAVQVRRPGPSWVQLTYTSADAIAGVKGGWGVKETTPADASPDIVADLRDGVTTRLDEVVETTQFASEAELAARARRLVFKVTNGVLTLFHAAAAGLDATGRPGNVYNHAAALVPDDLSVRPIDYWRTPDWLEPFGAAEVTAARLGELRPGTTITRSSTIAFLRDGDRVFNLEWILAAVSRACLTNSTLALVADTADEAASWIGAITYLTSPGLARRLSFVTFERASRLGDSALAGLRIVAVPRVDLPALEAMTGSVLVVDPTWSLEDPAGEGAWRTPLGQTFAPDESWQSGLIDLFALDDDRILRIMAASDEITASFSGAELAALPLHWSLSMAMLADPEVQVSDRAQLTFECLRVAPATALDVPGVQAMLDKVAADLQGASVRDLVSNGQVGPLLQRVAAAAVMREYLDGGWQTDRAPGLPANLTATALDDNRGSIASAIRGAEGVMMGSADQILAGARLVSLLLDHPGTGREPEALRVPVAAFRSQLAKPELAAHVDEVAQLNPSLITRARPEPPQELPATAPPPQPPRAEPRRGQPAGVVAPPAAPPVAALTNAPAARGPAGLTELPEDQAEAWAELLIDAPFASERYQGLVDAVRVAGGVRWVPLTDLPDGLYDRAVAAALAGFRSDANPTPVRAAFGAWAAAFYALDEVTDRREQPPSDLVEAIRAWHEPYTAELVRLLNTAPMSRVHKLIAVSILRACNSPGVTTLGIKAKDGIPLGWRAVRRAVAAMPDARYEEVQAALRRDLVEVKRLAGSFYDSTYETELLARAAPVAAEIGRRKGP